MTIFSDEFKIVEVPELFCFAALARFNAPRMPASIAELRHTYRQETACLRGTIGKHLQEASYPCGAIEGLTLVYPDTACLDSMMKERVPCLHTVG